MVVRGNGASQNPALPGAFGGAGRLAAAAGGCGLRDSGFGVSEI